MSLVVIVNVQRCQPQRQLDRCAVRQISTSKVAYSSVLVHWDRFSFFLYLLRSMYLRRTSTGRSFTLELDEDGRPWNRRVSAIGLRHLGLTPSPSTQ